MGRFAFLLAISVMPAAYSTEIRLEGGRFELAGQMEVDNLTVGAGAMLQGAGTVDGSGLIAGSVSPGSGAAVNIGTLTFSGDLGFQTGSVFDCYAATHTSLDKLRVDGTVFGACEVSLTRDAAAIPLHQVILDGGAASDYSLFGATPTNWTLATVPIGDLELTELTGDSDADSLPDWWEYDYFSSRTDADPNANGDDDTALNWEEWIAGTDPTNGLSQFIILSVASDSPPHPVITWASVDGKRYSIYRKDNLLTDSCMLIESNIAGTAPANRYTNSLPEGNLWLYYRVGIQP